MRSTRLALIFFAFYLTFLGGSAYYVLIFPLRIFHHAFITIILSVWLFRRVRNGNGLPRTPLNNAIYASVGVWFITAITSLDPRIAFENTWFLIVHLILFFAIVDLLQRARHKLIFEAQFMLATVVIFMTGIEVASWYFGLGITPNTEVGWISAIDSGFIFPTKLPRVSLAMNISTLLAGYVAPLITICAGWAMTVRQKDYRQVLWILAFLLTGVLILTFSRGGLLSLITAIGALVAMRIAQIPNLTQRITPRVILGGATAIGILGVVGFMIFTLSGNRNSGDEGRLDMYRSALEISVDYPITGVGTSQFGRAFRDYRTPDLARDKLASAHNYYLNVLAESGILGVIVNLWLGYLLLRTWWQRWQEATSSKRKLRLEATFAALLGVGVHQMVDVFTTTPVVLMLLVLLAYSITGQRDILVPPPKGQRIPAMIGFVIILAYGGWFVQLDRAQVDYQFSLIEEDYDEALDRARSAQEIDPHLNLYDLNIAYLVGEHALENPTEANLNEAIALYEDALALEPTWDIGWLNLAQLVLEQGDEQRAFVYIERAWEINPITPASFGYARYGELLDVLPPEEIIEHYRYSSRVDGELPTSEAWQATPLRIEAINERLDDLPIDAQYRVLAIIDPDRAQTLVTDNPQSAREWWILGEYTLTTENNPELAETYFDEAISGARTNGDYYVSRARATLFTDPDSARNDLEVAYLLGTNYEYPNAVLAQLETDDGIINQLLAEAIPARRVLQEFSAVLYAGRYAIFDIPLNLRLPNYGHEALLPWYTLAEHHLETGDVESAITVYEAIRDYSPYEVEAQQRLAELSP